MAIYALRRLIEGIPVMILASIFVFGLLHMVPGDPAANLSGPDASDQDVEVIQERFCLDKPVVQQYLTWIGHAVTGAGSAAVAGLWIGFVARSGTAHTSLSEKGLICFTVPSGMIL